MPKQYQIRWRDQDVSLLKRSARNFNAKITRLEKKYKKELGANPTQAEYELYVKKIAALPSKITGEELKELKDDIIRTRQDFNREIKSLKRFSKRGAEELVAVGNHNTLTTKWQRKEISILKRIVNLRKDDERERRKDLYKTHEGKPLYPYEAATQAIGMGNTESVRLDHVEGLTNDIKQAWEIRRVHKSLQHQASALYFRDTDIRMKENYIHAIKTHFPDYMVKDLIDGLESMSIDDFVSTVLTDEGASWEMPYPGDIESMHQNVNSMKVAFKITKVSHKASGVTVNKAHKQIPIGKKGK